MRVIIRGSKELRYALAQFEKDVAEGLGLEVAMARRGRSKSKTRTTPVPFEAVEEVRSLHVLPGGASRSEWMPPYHLVPPQGTRRVAQRFALGARIHGEENWKKSCTTETNALIFAREAYNHMTEHALKMATGDYPDDDHLGAIGWAVSVLSYIEEKFHTLWTSLDGQVKP